MTKLILDGNKSINTSTVFYTLVALFVAERIFPELEGVTNGVKELLIGVGFFLSKDANK